MSLLTVANSSTFQLRNALVAGLVGGLVGGLAMGVILHLGSNMMPFIGALYGWPTVFGGWIAHLINSALIGLLFAVLASRPVFREQTATVGGSVLFGIVYASAVGLATGGIMLPAAMHAIGTETLPEPVFPLPGIIGGILVVLSVGVAHIVYGLLLGATYGVITARTG